MMTLYHSPLSPPCRTVRIMLAEKGIEAVLQEEKAWERREAFLAMNPAGTLPVLEDDQGLPVAELWPICEFLEEVFPERPLIGTDPYARAEARRLLSWFEHKFAQEVSELLLEEKVVKRISRRGQPDSGALRAARHNIRYHVECGQWHHPKVPCSEAHLYPVLKPPENYKEFLYGTMFYAGLGKVEGEFPRWLHMPRQSQCRCLKRDHPRYCRHQDQSRDHVPGERVPGCFRIR